MTDKRPFHTFLNRLKDQRPSAIAMIESIQDQFEKTFEPITNAQKVALRNLPEQYVKRIYNDDREWTTRLHQWAEQGVSEILKLSPMLLAFKNSLGDSVLMCLMAGATGAYTEKINYDLIRQLLALDLSYTDMEKGKDGKETEVLRNALEVTDVNEQTPIDYLIDYAYGSGAYEGYDADDQLIELLNEFAQSIDPSEEKEEEEEEEEEEEPEEVAESEPIVEVEPEEEPMFIDGQDLMDDYNGNDLEEEEVTEYPTSPEQYQRPEPTQHRYY